MQKANCFVTERSARPLFPCEHLHRQVSAVMSNYILLGEMAPTVVVQVCGCCSVRGRLQHGRPALKLRVSFALSSCRGTANRLNEGDMDAHHGAVADALKS